MDEKIFIELNDNMRSIVVLGEIASVYCKVDTLIILFSSGMYHTETYYYTDIRVRDSDYERLRRILRKSYGMIPKDMEVAIK